MQVVHKEENGEAAGQRMKREGIERGERTGEAWIEEKEE